jgi:hypothetical protein
MPKWAMHSGMLGASKKAELLSLNSDLIVFCTQTNAYENTLVLLSGAFTDFAESARARYTQQQQQSKANVSAKEYEFRCVAEHVQDAC